MRRSESKQYGVDHCESVVTFIETFTGWRPAAKPAALVFLAHMPLCLLNLLGADDAFRQDLGEQCG